MNGSNDEIEAAAEVPSQHQANKLTRVLTGKPLKFTVRINYRDGRVIEFQSDRTPNIVWQDASRDLWITQGITDYINSPVMPWEVGMMITTEENPK